jgi:uncharacterized protein
MVTLLLELIVITPMVVMALNKPDYKWKYLLLFVAYYFLYTNLLFLPHWIPELRIIENTWNWAGKTYAIAGSVLFYFLFTGLLSNYNYITLKQNDNSLKPKTFIILTVFLVAAGLAFFFIKKSDTRFGDLLFQSIMPGIDEELAFRGIMLGLLSTALRSKFKLGSVNIGNPALLITSTLFGLVHSLHIGPDWDFHQDWFEFINTFATGWLLGWLTIRSGSILLSIVVHNLINILPIIIWLLVKSG